MLRPQINQTTTQVTMSWFVSELSSKLTSSPYSAINYATN